MDHPRARSNEPPPTRSAPSSPTEKAVDPSRSSPDSLPTLCLEPGTTEKTSKDTPEDPLSSDDLKSDAAGFEWVDDSANPYNWPSRRKWRVALTVSITAFMSTAGSSMAAPVAAQIGEHFGEHREKVQTLLTVCYVLGMGFGPFLFAPVAELYGRQAAYVTSTLPFVLFNAACIGAPNFPALVVLRFFAGVFASSGPALGIATCSDVFSPRERGTPISIYAAGPAAGPTLGSLIAGWLALTNWRWTFGVLTILSALNGVAVILFMSETYGPVVQYRLAFARRETQGSARPRTALERHLGKWEWVVGLARERDWKTVFQKAFTRPFRFLLLNPVLAFFALYYAFIYATIYTALVTVPLLFARTHAINGLFNYGWAPAIFPLCYFGLGVGFVSAATTAANAQNRIYAHLCKRNGDSGQPEYRLVLVQIGMLFFPIGWLIYGWCAQAQTHWMGPLVGLVLAAYGLMLSFNALQNFVVDWTAPYSAAGVAGITFARSVVACLLPIYAPQMFDRLGWGWGGTTMACVSVVAMPAPAVMWVFGKRLRERWKVTG